MQPRKRRPNRFQHLVHALGASVRLNPEPEHGKDNSTDHAEVAEPETEGRPIQDRKRNMEACTDCSVEHHDHGNDYVT